VGTRDGRQLSSVAPLRVIVTAGAAGIGRSIATAFAGDGARVHVGDIDPAALGECRALLPPSPPPRWTWPTRRRLMPG
jgi:hypothetical protein